MTLQTNNRLLCWETIKWFLSSDSSSGRRWSRYRSLFLAMMIDECDSSNLEGVKQEERRLQKVGGGGRTKRAGGYLIPVSSKFGGRVQAISGLP